MEIFNFLMTVAGALFGAIVITALFFVLAVLVTICVQSFKEEVRKNDSSKRS